MRQTTWWLKGCAIGYMPCCSGTLCDGKVQGTFAAKIMDCLNCEFYELVRKEEGPDFKRVKRISERLDGLET